jgi:hypothetical protein
MCANGPNRNRSPAVRPQWAVNLARNVLVFQKPRDVPSVLVRASDPLTKPFQPLGIRPAFRSPVFLSASSRPAEPPISQAPSARRVVFLGSRRWWEVRLGSPSHQSVGSNTTMVRLAVSARCRAVAALATLERKPIGPAACLRAAVPPRRVPRRSGARPRRSPLSRRKARFPPRYRRPLANFRA